MIPRAEQGYTSCPMALETQVGKPCVDLSRYELTVGGERVKLERQPMDLLILFIERKGQLVTRGEIVSKLWGKDVFVDVDGSINHVIRKIRNALHDDPDQPKYLETVFGKGYRFIGNVDVIRTSPAEERVFWNPRRLLLAGAVALILMAVATWGWSEWRQRRGLQHTQIRSLAVLPFENLSGDANQDYVADGITDFLTTDLAKVHQLRIVSRTSANRYKKTNKAVPDIARELGVDAVVEGSFGRDGDRVRITAQLIDGRADRHLWAENYERQASDLFTLQSELAHAVAREVAFRLSPEEEAAFASSHTVNPDAWDSYVKGRYYFSQRMRAGFQQCYQYFQQAVAQDPAFAQAYAGLAECTWQAGNFGLIPMEDAKVKAKAAALKAIELDSNSSEAHAALGYILLNGDWDWAGARKELSRALELNPNNARVHAIFALYHWAMGNKAETIAEAKLEKELDPLNPSSLTSLGWYYLWAGQDDLAEAQFREALNLNPNTILAHRGLGNVYAHRKLFDQAATEHFGGLSHSSSDPPEIAKQYLKAYKQNGYDAAERTFFQYQLEQAQEAAKSNQPAACDFANAYVDLGDKKNALYWMEKAIKDHCRPIMAMKSEPRFDFLRGEPQFRVLLGLAGLEPPK